MKKTYDTTVARIAGNLLAGATLPVSATGYVQYDEARRVMAERAVAVARAIVAEVERTEPKVEP